MQRPTITHEEPSQARPGADRPPTRPAARTPAAEALMLQRLVGNRAAARALARWAAHPDPEKKGTIVPDVVAADFLRFNPPKNS